MSINAEKKFSQKRIDKRAIFLHRVAHDSNKRMNVGSKDRTVTEISLPGGCPEGSVVPVGSSKHRLEIS